jgi:phosphoribosylaminoimidazolecarboxamide formyltransferase/IMP cyclohydrolase
MTGKNVLPYRIVVFASGNGSNAQRIAEHFGHGPFAEVVAVFTDNPSAGVLVRAKSLDISTECMSRSLYTNGSQLLERLRHHRADFIVLAGYLKLVPDLVTRAYEGRIINIHPSLLPRHGGKGMHGAHVHQAVLAAKEPESGITIHHVNERYDEGAVIFQAKLQVQPSWNADDLASAIHQLEYTHFPAITENLLRNLPHSGAHPLEMKKPQSALISVYHKDGLDSIAHSLHEHGVHLISTGGTASFLRELGLPVSEVSDLTAFPSILGGRVKTLHPTVFGGILARRSMPDDIATLEAHQIPQIDIVIVDLYPFEDTVASGAPEAEVIEKIDIGGISLIRAAAKNFADVICVPSRAHYEQFHRILRDQQAHFSLAQRKEFAAEAFDISSHYDTQIHNYLVGTPRSLKVSERSTHVLRYGENPHQKAAFHGDLDALFEQLQGKALSYNNLLDVDAALGLWEDFKDGAPFFAIFKHTNPCGVATGSNLKEAWDRALACDPVSAFGGILICNGSISHDIATAIDEIFFEVLIADQYEEAALALLRKKKNRILLRRKDVRLPSRTLRTAANGILVQDKDKAAVDPSTWQNKCSRKVEDALIPDLVFAEIVGKHLKSNAIAIVRNGQLIGSGAGQTSRVDSLRQAIGKAAERGFKTEGAVLYSDAFFPFKDCAEIALAAGIKVLAEPGGSIRDQETIDYCEMHDMSLIFTNLRRFKH